MNIKQLDPALVAKIAAGEVVERPINVVKELVENALDAGATSIQVTIKNAGKDLIEIRDNGKGMSKDDLEASVKAHTTSKISSLEDLFSIHTLGFRGEALHSICAVAKVSIQTTEKDAEQGYKLVVEGGSEPVVSVCAPAPGTIIRVEELFYNVPARKKFLKSSSHELQQIISVMQSYVLSRTDVSFRLIHDKRTIIESPQVASQKQKLAHIYGTQVAKASYAFSEEHEGVTISGVLVSPEFVRADKSHMTFFLNGRYITSTAFGKAVVEGYDTLLMIGKYPITVLSIDIDPTVVDVNVHPSKLIVKFENEELVYDLIRSAIANCIQGQHLLRSVETEDVVPVSTQETLVVEEQKEEKSTVQSEKQTVQYTPAPSISSQHVAESAAVYQAPLQTEETTADQEKIEQPIVYSQTQSVLEKTSDVLESSIEDFHVRVLAILHKTYVVCENKQGLLMVDFHAAHERYHYELFMNQYYKQGIEHQQLLDPLVLDVTAKQLVAFEEYNSEFQKLGFASDVFGENSIKITTVPVFLGRQQHENMFFQLLDEFETYHAKTKNAFEELQQKIITRMSCKASDRAGDDISLERAKNLIAWALSTKQKYACPHGRPIFMQVSLYELEKMFKRKV